MAKVEDKYSRMYSEDELYKTMELIKEISYQFEHNPSIADQLIENNKVQLVLLLNYIIKHSVKCDIAPHILRHICKMLGINLSNGKDEEIEEELEEELSNEEKQRRMRLVIYELYKITNPRQLAGETEIENFINNVLTRGLKTALKYDSGGVAKSFSEKDLNNLESWKPSFVASIKCNGVKSIGL